MLGVIPPFNHRSFQQSDPFSLGFRRFYGRKDP